MDLNYQQFWDRFPSLQQCACNFYEHYSARFLGLGFGFDGSSIRFFDTGLQSRKKREEKKRKTGSSHVERHVLRVKLARGFLDDQLHQPKETTRLPFGFSLRSQLTLAAFFLYLSFPYRYIYFSLPFECLLFSPLVRWQRIVDVDLRRWL